MKSLRLNKILQKIKGHDKDKKEEQEAMTTTTPVNHIDIEIAPTPNPNALKFILDRNVKTEGKSTYTKPSDCKDNALALALFTIRGIEQIHFFSNVITVTKFGHEEWDSIESQIIDCIHEKIDQHNPNYFDPDPEKDRRSALSEDLQKIEEILDKTIRPGLQGDGGDLQCLSYDDHILIIKYEGACGTCPSSTQGTLSAIQGILREQFDEHLEVYTQPA